MYRVSGASGHELWYPTNAGLKRGSEKESKSFHDHMIGYIKYVMKDMMLSDLV